MPATSRKAKLIAEMENNRALHVRGHYTVSERCLIQHIVEIIKAQRELDTPAFDPVIHNAKAVLADMQG
jgi:hypothetical protein